MELKQLEAFIKVVEFQSFSKAAKVLYLTQPTISAHIVSLEKELESKLLERTTKKVACTKDGEKLYEYAKEILGIKEEILEKFLQKSPEGNTIFISASTIPSLYVLPQLIPLFQKQTPDICFSLNQGDSREAIRDILTHKAEIGFVGMKTKDKKLQYIPFLDDRLVIILPNEEKYRNMLREKCSLTELLRKPIILREQGSGMKREAEKFLEEQGISVKGLSVVAHINDQEIIKRSVSQGMGISIISRKSAEDFIDLGKILVYEPEESKITRSLYMVFEKKKRFRKVIKAFMEFVIEYYKNYEIRQ